MGATSSKTSLGGGDYLACDGSPRSSQNLSRRGAVCSFKLSVPRSDARVELFLSESSNAGTPVNECFLNLGSSAMDELQKVQTSAVQDASPFPHDAYQIFLEGL